MQGKKSKFKSQCGEGCGWRQRNRGEELTDHIGKFGTHAQVSSVEGDVQARLYVSLWPKGFLSLLSVSCISLACPSLESFAVLLTNQSLMGTTNSTACSSNMPLVCTFLQPCCGQNTTYPTCLDYSNHWPEIMIEGNTMANMVWVYLAG